MRAPISCPRAGACKGSLSVAYGSGAEPVTPAAPAAATAARTAKVRYPAPLKTGPLVSSRTLGSVRFSLRKGQHKRIKLRLAKHSHADLKLLKGATLGLVVSQKRGKAKLAYAVGTARTR
jgi:ABC-type microcin C transport system duplicated ATPase subunit YejF